MTSVADQNRDCVFVPVSPPVSVLLAALAAHDRLTVGALIGELACERARQVGLHVLARAVAEREEADQ